MQLLDAKLKITKKKVDLIFEGKVILSLDRCILQEESKINDVSSQVNFEAEQLIKVYIDRARKFYKRPVTFITPKSKNYKHFINALEIIKRHDVSYKDYIESQIDGLNFTKKFPTPNQLTTEGAEVRLLDYLQKVEVGGTDESREELRKKYNDLCKKRDSFTASIKEAKELAKVEKVLFNEIKSKTRAYLHSLRS